MCGEYGRPTVYAALLLDLINLQVPYSVHSFSRGRWAVCVCTFRRSETFPICNKKPPPTGPEHHRCLRDDWRNNQRLWIIFRERLVRWHKWPMLQKLLSKTRILKKRTKIYANEGFLERRRIDGRKLVLNERPRRSRKSGSNKRCCHYYSAWGLWGGLRGRNLRRTMRRTMRRTTGQMGKRGRAATK